MIIDMRKIPEIITARLTESGISIPKEREIVQKAYGGYSSSVDMDISLDLPSELKVNMATEPKVEEKLYGLLKDNVAEKNEVSQMKAITSTTKYTPKKTEPSRRGVRNVKRPTSTTKETAKKNETSSITQLGPITFDIGHGMTATLSESGIDLSPKPQYTIQATSEGIDLVPLPLFQAELQPEGIDLQPFGTPTQNPTVPVWSGTESYSAAQIVESIINQPTSQPTEQTSPQDAVEGAPVVYQYQDAVEGAPVVYQYTVPYYIPVESQADLTELATAGDGAGDEPTTWDKIKAWLEENWYIIAIAGIGFVGLIVALKGGKKKGR
jgi:hypothetical protein